LVLCAVIGIAWADSLDRAKKLYLLGEYDNSICELRSSQGMFTKEELYLMGMNYLKVGDYPQARKYFRSILKKYKQTDLYEQAMVKLGDAFFLEGNYDKAENLYENMLEKYSRTRFKPLLYLRLAQISSKDGHWDREKKYIRKIKKDFSQSTERKYADILDDRGYFFTIQVGAFSRKDNAENLAAELKPDFDSYLAREKLGEDFLYKVRVGKYQQRGPAEQDYRKLIDLGLPARIYP